MAVEDDNDVHVNACCLMKQLQSLLWAEVGYDVKIIEYITESFRSYQFQQLYSLMIDVDVESIARGDTHICSSFTEKAIAVSMNAWKCSGLDSWAMRFAKIPENSTSEFQIFKLQNFLLENESLQFHLDERKCRQCCVHQDYKRNAFEILK